MKGLRVAGARTLEEANRYLEQEFLPWWNQHLRVVPANAADAHRPLAPEHDLASALSRVETRQVGNDYTFRFDGKLYQIARADVRAGLRGGTVRSRPGWTARCGAASRTATWRSANANRGPRLHPRPRRWRAPGRRASPAQRSGKPCSATSHAGPCPFGRLPPSTVR